MTESYAWLTDAPCARDSFDLIGCAYSTSQLPVPLSTY